MLPKSLLVTATLVVPAVLAAKLPVRLVCFNIRQATSSPGKGEELWTVRAPYVIDQLSETAASAPKDASTIIGMQEVVHVQLTDIQDGLGDGWGHIGVGRDDGLEGGEFSPILYQTDNLRVLYNETKWLSLTPDLPSLGWGATNRRVVTTGVFEDIESGERFIASNTHLDHETPLARTEGIKVIIDRLLAIQEEYGPLAVSLMGDFNTAPDGDAYAALMELGYVQDVYDLAKKREGSEGTFTSFIPGNEGDRIDYIFVGPTAGKQWKVDRYEVLDNVVNGVSISDHQAVVGDLRLRY